MAEKNDSKFIAGIALGAALVVGSAAVMTLDNAEAQKRMVPLVQVDPASLKADYLELRRLPDAGVQVLCRGVVSGDDGAQKPIEPSSFEADESTRALFQNAMAACDEPLKDRNPKLK